MDQMIDPTKYAEARRLLNEDSYEEAGALIAELVRDFEEQYPDIQVNSETDAYFSFTSPLEQLVYRRADDDDRNLINVADPVDSLYAMHSFVLMTKEEVDAAREALASAIRWNPVKCAYRYNLAEIYLKNGDPKEYLGLTYSCFARAMTREDLEHAFLNFVPFFAQSDQVETAAAALYAAEKVGAPRGRRFQMAEALLAENGGTELYDQMTDERMELLLEEQGLPQGASAEVVVALLVMEEREREKGNRLLAADYHSMAVALVGAPAVAVLQDALDDTNTEEG